MRPLAVVAGVIMDGDLALIARRPQGEGPEGGKWEFPGGKIEPGETPEDALRRELMEELGAQVRVEKILDAQLKQYGAESVLILFYLCALEGGEMQAREHAALQFVAADQLNAYDLADADRRAALRIFSDKEISRC